MLNKIGHLLLKKAPANQEPEMSKSREHMAHKEAMHAMAKHIIDAVHEKDHVKAAEMMHAFHTMAATAPEQNEYDGEHDGDGTTDGPY